MIFTQRRDMYKRTKKAKTFNLYSLFFADELAYFFFKQSEAAMTSWFFFLT